MSLNSGQKLKKILAAFLVCGSFLFIVLPNNALAASTNYEKLPNGTLTATEWNNLKNDFVNTWEQMRMNGPLGINTTTPSTPIFLAVGGNLRADTGLFSGVGIGTTNPLDLLSIGDQPSAGSGIGAGHNSTQTYLSADTYALANIGYVQSVLAPVVPGGSNALWSGAKDSNIWNGTAGVGKVGIGTTNPVAPLHVVTNTSGNTIWLQGRSDGISQILFADNANTGVGRIKVNTGYMAFFEGASEDMRINNGNVGIGTTAPNAKLQVNGNVTLAGAYNNAQLNFAANTTNIIIGTTRTDNTSPGYIKSNGWGSFSINNGLAVGYDWPNSGQSGMIINGNVGIGTTTPLDLLSIGAQPSTGSTIGTGHNSTMGYLSTDTYALANIGYVQSVLAPVVPGGSNSLWSGAKDSTIWNGTSGAGNVGIGTTNPGQKLEVAGNIILTAPGNALASRYIGQGGVYSTGVGANSGFSGMEILTTTSASAGDSVLNFLTLNGGVSNAPRMTIDKTGNVGIGTTNPLSNLQVGNLTSSVVASPVALSLGGTYSNSAGTNAKLKLYDIGGTDTYGLGVSASQFDFMAPTGAHYSWNINGAEKVRIDTTGNVGIGTTGPGANLEVMSATGGTLRLKRDNVSVFAEDTIGTMEFYSNDADGPHVTSFIKSVGADVTGNYGRMGALTFGVSKTANVDAVEAMRIDASGNVGIGTTTPLDLLSIGPQYSTGSNLGTGHNSTPTYLSTDSYALVNYGLLKSVVDPIIPGGSSSLWDGSRSGNIWSGNSKNVGIGTTNPRYNLSIGNDIGDLTAGVGAKALVLGNSTANTLFAQGQDATHNLQFYWMYNATAGNAVGNLVTYGYNNPLRIDASVVSLQSQSTGSVGIGTTVPRGKLHVYSQESPALNYYNGQLQVGGDFGVLNDVSLSIGTDYISDKTFLQGWNGGVGASDILLNPLGGYVGIGTTNPLTKLQVNSDGAALALQAVTAGTGSLYFDFRDSAGAERGYFGYGSSDNTFYIANLLATKMYFYNNNGIKMTIDTAGNVGIGTTTPLDLLSIGPQTTVGSNLGTGHNSTPTYLSTDTYALANIGYVQTVADGINNSSLWSGAKNGPIWNGTSGAGNVGIGTTNPLVKLQIESGGASVVQQNFVRTSLGSGVSEVGNLNFYDSASYLIAQMKAIEGGDTTGSGALVFSTTVSGGSLAEAMRINKNGNVGIGTINPLTTLDVSGNSTTATIYPIIARNTTNTSAAGGNVGIKFNLSADVDGANKWVSIESFDTSNWGSSGGLSFTTNNGYTKTKSMVIDHIGKVGIGTTDPGAYRLSVIGDVLAGNGSAITTRVFDLLGDATSGTGINQTSELRLIPGPISSYASAPALIGYKIGTGGSIGVRDYGLKLQVTNDNVAGTAVTIDNLGNVGIGTTTPLDLLSIGPQTTVGSNLGTGHNSTPTYLSTDTYALANIGYVQTVANGITNSSLWSGTKDNTIWNGTSGAGNVGVGTTAPTYKMEISGTFKAATSSSSIILDASGNVLIGI